MRTILDTEEDFQCDIQSPCFQLLTPDEAEMVKSSKTQVHFRKGENLTKQGAFASYVLFILKGYAKQHIEGDQSKTFNLRIIRPGEFVGLSSVFSKNTFNYSAVAITDCLAFLIEKDTIAKLVKQNGLFAFNFIQRYCEQNTNLFDKLRTIQYKQMNGRMAEILLYLNSFKENFPEIFLNLSRKELAEFAGISMESAVKLLKAFEKDKLISLVDKDIQILNENSLQEISLHG